jgi:hypothetical protein
MFGFPLAPAVVVAVGFDLDLKTRRQRPFGCERPAAVELETHFPQAVAETVIITFMIIMVRISYDDV